MEISLNRDSNDCLQDIEEEEKEEESKKNQRWFSGPTSENALAQSRMIAALLLPSIVVDGLSTVFSEEASRPAFAFHAACSAQPHFVHLIISLSLR